MANINNRNRIEITQNKAIKEVLKVMIHKTAKGILNGAPGAPTNIAEQKRYNFASQVVRIGLSDIALAQYILNVFEGESAIDNAVGGPVFNINTMATYISETPDNAVPVSTMQTNVDSVFDLAAGILPGDDEILL